MDAAHVRRELRGSIRLLWTEERWLWSGAVAVLAGFGLWVGATGAALNYGIEFAGRPVSVTSWSPATTAVFATGLFLWVVAPAGVVTSLIDSSLTNVSGNVHTHYRVEHPSVLVVPALALVAVGAGAAVAVGDVPASLAGVLVAVGLFTLVRTTAYSYRVFSCSVPRVLHLSLFVSLAVTAVALLAGVATLAARRAFVADVAAGVAGLVGRPTVADAATGTTAFGPVTVPTLPGVGAALPVALAVGYLLVQSIVGSVSRARKRDVPRSHLRTGQRYPEFARPTTDDGPTRPARDSSPDPSPVAGTADTAAASDGDGQSTGTTEPDVDSVRHTKVFTAPDDVDFDGISAIDDATDGSEETAVVGSDDGDTVTAYRCLTCGETFGPETNFAYCPTCGTELESRS